MFEEDTQSTEGVVDIGTLLRLLQRNVVTVLQCDFFNSRDCMIITETRDIP